MESLKWLLENRDVKSVFSSHNLIPRSLFALLNIESYFQTSPSDLIPLRSIWMNEWARIGSIELIKVGLERGWAVDDTIRRSALLSGNITIVELLGFQRLKNALIPAIRSGNLDIVSYLWKQLGEPPLKSSHFLAALRVVRLKRQGPSLLKWLVAHRCPVEVEKAFESYLFIDLEEGKVACAYANRAVLDYLLSLDPSFLSNKKWHASFMLTYGFAGTATRFADGCRPTAVAFRWFLSKLQPSQIATCLQETHSTVAPYLGRHFENVSILASARGDKDMLVVLYSILPPDDPTIEMALKAAIFAGNLNVLNFFISTYREQVVRICQGDVITEYLRLVHQIPSVFRGLNWLIEKNLIVDYKRA